jgi:hypothetical protein
MSILRSHARRTAVAAAVAGVALAGALGTGTAAHAATHGIFVREQCATVTGQTSYKPGLRSSKVRSVATTLSATTSNCSNSVGQAVGGNGSFTASLNGNASLAAENFSGSFTIDWPGGTGLNPSNGTLTVTESNGIESVSGTITSGAFYGSPVSLAFHITGNSGKGTRRHPVIAQDFANTQPLQVTGNDG